MASNKKDIKPKPQISSFEKKANIIMIMVTAIIFILIGVGVYFSFFYSPTPQMTEKQKQDILKQIEEQKKAQENQNKTEQAKKPEYKLPAALEKEQAVNYEIKTTKGNIKIALYPKLMPITVENFVGLIKKNFYNNLTFHRVEDWVIQGGDPKGNGTGGSDKTIKLETNKKLSNIRGAVAMARSTEPDTASSQFYIVKKDATQIDGEYAVFGMVLEGMDIVDSIAIGDKIVEIKAVK